MRGEGDESAWARASVRNQQRRAGAQARARSEEGGLHAPEPVVCAKRGGTTPTHPEPGRETPQRRGYWREARWESRSAHQTRAEG